MVVLAFAVGAHRTHKGSFTGIKAEIVWGIIISAAGTTPHGTSSQLAQWHARLLVAMIIFTFPMTSKPSSWDRSSMSVRWISLSAEVPSLNLRPPMASISSMKMMHG